MIEILSRDTDELPQALLAGFKKHERIDTCDDDELIVDKLAMAIERLEIKSGIGIFAASYLWTPDQWSDVAVEVPRPPVKMWIAEADGIDVTSSYVMQTDAWGGEIAPVRLAGTWQTDLQLTITTGFDAASLPPGIKDLIYRMTGHLYEYREIYVPGNITQQSQWLDDQISGYWQPRA